MSIVKVTLEQVLAARDARVACQRRLLAQFAQPLLCLTMNIPGERKDSPLIRYAFFHGVSRVRQALGPALLQEELCPAATGCEAFFVCDLPAEQVKALAIAIEEEGEIGRLYDLDVLAVTGEKLSRPASRTCIICGGPVSICSRSRAHGLPALTARVGEILSAFAASALAELAVESLIAEAEFSPKPGLVDSRNNGAHRDMDLPLLRRSAQTLRPSFAALAAAGLADAAPGCYRQIGIAAEQAMLTATGGVNTHKGAIYGLGLLLAAAGLLLAQHCPAERDASAPAASCCCQEGLPPVASLATRPAALCAVAASLARTLAAEGSASVTPLTHGEDIRRRYQAGGALAEAAAGFPHAQSCYAWLQAGQPLTGLLHLLAETEDSNLLWRGGLSGLDFVRSEAACILQAPEREREALTQALDQACIRRNLSPGGCADLFSLALFLQKIAALPCWD